MRPLFTFLSVSYIAAIFLLADSPKVSDFSAFNPYSLLHIPLYGILTVLLILSFMPFKLKRNNATNPITQQPNDPMTELPNDSTAQLTHVRFFLPGVISLFVAIADEIHQSFIPTRNASIIDVLLDLIGIILTLFLISKYKKNSITDILRS